MTFSLSSSIIAFCAMLSIPVTFSFEESLPDRAPRGSLSNRGGSCAISLRRRGAEVEDTRNSLGLSRCCRWSVLVNASGDRFKASVRLRGMLVEGGGDGFETSARVLSLIIVLTCAAGLVTPCSISRFWTLRTWADDCCIAVLMSGIMLLSTRLHACLMVTRRNQICSETHLLK